MNIGNKIKNLRRIKNLTQEELAERTDLSKGYISQIESEHASPSMETFLNIIEVLGTTPSEFFRFFIFYGGKVKLPAFFNTQKAQLPL